MFPAPKATTLVECRISSTATESRREDGGEKEGILYALISKSLDCALCTVLLGRYLALEVVDVRIVCGRLQVCLRSLTRRDTELPRHVEDVTALPLKQSFCFALETGLKWLKLDGCLPSDRTHVSSL